jgi:hypothetical protein
LSAHIDEGREWELSGQNDAGQNGVDNAVREGDYVRRKLAIHGTMDGSAFDSVAKKCAPRSGFRQQLF